MKIRLFKTKGNLNPLPVMGKDAFVEFAREWCNYIHSLGLELIPRVYLPNYESFTKYFNKWGGTSRLALGIFANGNPCGIYDIAHMKGYCNNPHMPGFDLGVTHPDLKNVASLSVETLADGEFNNIIFETIIHSASLDAQQISYAFAQARLKYGIGEIIRETKRLVYSRSALVHRGLFGGYTMC